ncbi:MAG: tRNA (adenosine(37)-N6)-threonylcarbamoyltransferase complex transferase subunit TsaD, partial [Planctomycetes bacterium]|nr:tRNA (adenosine(37)-N6)-threonylcarbamoyltransferase complex transferase subunit TsaD [Planctomycetota bacterium]
MKILGIESSCDETAVAIVEDGYKILSSVVASQIAQHKPLGGVVPEVAAREHHKNLPHILDRAFNDQFKLEEIDAFAVTSQPGLIGALLIGVSAAKTLAWRMNKPLISIDHIDGHIYSAYLHAKSAGVEIDKQFVALVVSGGHTAMFHVKNPLENELIGKTRDDAAGEAFDKVAAMLNLDYPGGP